MIVKKAELKEVLKRSPDTADAAALTCLERFTGDDPLMVADRNVSGVTAAEEEQIMSEY
jgi:hypothetical protein